ncbi:hypothetical protein C1H46_027083 [Malus baccata]|uniref:Uncharacterized protein n=1 Tax=Malus baccata TaxID=106549 RepID=A0A540LLI2_MALBA|nr:hypothetical protein C1H46_027083 [Malus baccata]
MEGKKESNSNMAKGASLAWQPWRCGFGGREMEHRGDRASVRIEQQTSWLDPL